MRTEREKKKKEKPAQIDPRGCDGSLFNLPAASLDIILVGTLVPSHSSDLSPPPLLKGQAREGGVVIGSYRNIWARSMRRAACYAAYNASGYRRWSRGTRRESDTYWNAGRTAREKRRSLSPLRVFCSRCARQIHRTQNMLGGRYGLAGTSRISSSGQQKLIEAKGAWDHNNHNHFMCSFFTQGQTFVFLTGAPKSGAQAPSGKCDTGLTHTHLNSLPT